MEMSSSRWKASEPSGFVWEQAGLNYIRERLPDRDPYRAWSNFEFIAFRYYVPLPQAQKEAALEDLF